MKVIRNIVKIDEDLCTGCGQCILDCAEGAIVLKDGKAKVIADMYCDGLGACLSGCPTGALTIIQREADAYDESAVEAHLAAHGRTLQHAGHGHEGHGHAKHEHHKGHGEHEHSHGHKHKHQEGHGGCSGHGEGHKPGECAGHGHKHEHGECSGHGHGHGHKHGGAGCGCAGSQAATLTPARPLTHAGCPGKQAEAFSAPGLAAKPFAGHGPAQPGTSTARGRIAAGDPNTHWPLKLRLMTPDAPFLKGADIVLAADCAAFASSAFHEHLRPGKVVLIGCPKFEGMEALAERLAEIFRVARPKSCTVVRMEVPCCMGIAKAVQAANAASGAEIPVREVIVTRQGDLEVC